MHFQGYFAQWKMWQMANGHKRKWFILTTPDHFSKFLWCISSLSSPLCSYWGAHFSLFWARKGTQQSISSIWPNALLSFSFCIYLDSFWDCFASCVQIDYGMGTILSWKGKRKKTNKHFILCISFGYYQISSCQKCREGACNCTSGGKILEL